MGIIGEVFSWWGGNTWSNRIYTLLRGRLVGTDEGGNRYYVQKLYEQAGNFTHEELDDAVIRLAQLDAALKGGSTLPGELEFTRALADITRGRETARVGA